MPRVTSLLRRSRKAIQDLDLLKVLQSEIKHELSSNRFPDNYEGGSLGDFKLDWDSPKSQDVVLRKKFDSGEEVAVSAVLGAETEEGIFPREALMKVCIKKPGLSSILQFDCNVFEVDGGSHLDIYGAYYLPSSTCLNSSSIYKGPSYSSLDPGLQLKLEDYLVSKGIEHSFTNFLLLHLHRKEQGQYVNWLRKMEGMVAQGDD